MRAVTVQNNPSAENPTVQPLFASPPQGSGNLEAIHIIKKTGGTLHESFLDEGFILDKKIGVGQPKRIENARILVANTPMDTDKIKIYGARVRVDSMAKVGGGGWSWVVGSPMQCQDTRRWVLCSRRRTNFVGGH